MIVSAYKPRQYWDQALTQTTETGCVYPCPSVRINKESRSSVFLYTLLREALFHKGYRRRQNRLRLSPNVCVNQTHVFRSMEQGPASPVASSDRATRSTPFAVWQV